MVFGGSFRRIWQCPSHLAQHDGTSYGIYSAKYTSGGSWGIQVLLDNLALELAYPLVGLDSFGNAIAVWRQLDAREGIYAHSARMQVSYTVTPSAGANGRISPTTPQTVTYNGTTTFAITQDAGYTTSVGGTCGGTLVGATYTTNAITADCSVSATFDAITSGPPVNPLITITGSPTSTTTRDITVNLSASDDVGVTGYYVSEIAISPSLADFTAVTPAINYSETVAFTLSSGEGVKTIFAWFRDGDGNIGAFAYVVISLDEDSSGVSRVPMYRAYNVASDHHFFTTNLASKDYAVSIGYNDESTPIPFYVYDAPVTGAAPFYRLYNPNSGQHFYTTSEVAKNWLVSLGMNYERIEAYISSTQAFGSVPLYRYYNTVSGSHLYTIYPLQNFLMPPWELHETIGYVFTTP